MLAKKAGGGTACDNPTAHVGPENLSEPESYAVNVLPQRHKVLALGSFRDTSRHHRWSHRRRVDAYDVAAWCIFTLTCAA